MICRICGEDINEKGQDNVSAISGYPVCEDCKDDIECDDCFASSRFEEIYYIEEIDKFQCAECIVKYAEEKGYIHSRTVYYSSEYEEELGCNHDIEGVLEYLKDNEVIEMQNVKGE